MAGIALPQEATSMVRRTLGSLAPHPASIGKIAGAKLPHLAGGGIANAENISGNMFQPIQQGGIPNVDANFITSPQLGIGQGAPKGQAAKPDQQESGVQEINQLGGAANTLIGAGKGIGSIGSSLWNGSTMSADDAGSYNAANGLAEGDADFASSGDTIGGLGDMLSSLGSSFMGMFQTAGPAIALEAAKGGAISGYAEGGGVPHRDIGGIVGSEAPQFMGLLKDVEPIMQAAAFVAPFLNKGGTVPEKAAGGDVPGVQSDTSMLMHREAGETFHQSGLLNSAGPGRTDTIHTNVPAGAYIVPADVVAGLGESNTLAGSAVIDKMFGTGPYGVKQPHIHGGKGAPSASAPRPISPDSEPAGVDTHFINSVGSGAYAKGGHVGEKAPVVLAGGEHSIPPDAIIKKFGSLKKGHRILDHWCVMMRQKNIKDLKSLPNPVGSRISKK